VGEGERTLLGAGVRRSEVRVFYSLPRGGTGLGKGTSGGELGGIVFSLWRPGGKEEAGTFWPNKKGPAVRNLIHRALKGGTTSKRGETGEDPGLPLSCKVRSLILISRNGG